MKGPRITEAEYTGLLQDFVFRYTRIHLMVAEQRQGRYRGDEDWDEETVRIRELERNALARLQVKLKISDEKKNILVKGFYQAAMKAFDDERNAAEQTHNEPEQRKTA